MPKKSLSKTEAHAIRMAVACGLRIRQHAGIPKIYMAGYWAGIQAVAASLPHARKLSRFNRAMDRLEKHINKT